MCHVLALPVWSINDKGRQGQDKTRQGNQTSGDFYRLKTMYTDVSQQISLYTTDADVVIVAASKSQSVERLTQAYQQGARHFGENYLQEAERKISKMAQPDIQWHFIGAIQSNKTRKVAEIFDWVQTVSQLKIAQRLNDQRPDNLPLLNICIQMNINNEQQKAGCRIEDVESLVQASNRLPRLCVRGIMTLPQQQPLVALAHTFERTTALFKRLQAQYPAMDTLSMGMSQDYMLAIKHGATMVRLGTVVFGAREQ